MKYQCVMAQALQVSRCDKQVEHDRFQVSELLLILYLTHKPSEISGGKMLIKSQGKTKISNLWLFVAVLATLFALSAAYNFAQYKYISILLCEAD